MPFSAGRVLINGGGRCWILLPEMRHPYALASAHQGRAGAEGDWLVGLCQAGYDRGGEGGLLSYDLRTLKAARGVPLAGPVKGMAIPADASRIFVVGFVPPWDLRVHDLRTFREVSRQPLGGDEPSILAASPDGSRLAVATENGGLGIYRAADLSIEESLQLWSKARSVAFSPSGRYLAVQLETVTHIFERK